MIERGPRKVLEPGRGAVEVATPQEPLAGGDDARPTVELESDLLGSIWFVPDKWWGCRAAGREDHPGACVDFSTSSSEATLLKGTGLKARRSGRHQFVVEPTATNGLRKATAFEIKPWHFSGRKIALLQFDRLIGQLAADDLKQLREELERVFG